MEEVEAVGRLKGDIDSESRGPLSSMEELEVELDEKEVAVESGSRIGWSNPSSNNASSLARISASSVNLPPSALHSSVVGVITSPAIVLESGIRKDCTAGVATLLALLLLTRLASSIDTALADRFESVDLAREGVVALIENPLPGENKEDERAAVKYGAEAWRRFCWIR